MSHPAPNPVPKRPPVGLYGGNILFAAPSNWDEACFAAPALRAIRSARPTCILGVICDKKQQEFWQSIHGINDIITYDSRSSTRSLMRDQAEARYTWESAILWENNLGAEYCYAAKIKQRLGYPAKKIQKWLTDPVLIATPIGPVEHRVQYYLRLMEKLHVPTQRADIFMPVDIGVPQIPGTIMVSPESDYGSHYEWPLEKWTELMTVLTEKLQAQVVIAGHPGSKTKLAAALFEQFSEQAQYVSLDPLGAALPLIAAQSLLIGADASVCHLAAHLGVTTISLFGPNDPAWRRPLGKQHAFIRQKTECAPCLMPKCKMDLRCQKELLCEQVTEIVLQKFVTPEQAL